LHGMTQKRMVTGHGKRLRTTREAKGLSLEAAAARAGISTPRASELERSHTIPTSWAAHQYAQALGFRIRGGKVRLEAVTVE
jgi:transcriptional regulator with XRE-family HTH domain